MIATRELRDHFLAWQCRIRQIAMRQDGGRPSPGMRPRVLVAGREIAPALTVLMVLKEPEDSTALFRFQVEKTSDPREVYQKGLALLQGDHFQTPGDFADKMTALLPKESTVAAKLGRARECVLEFDQFAQHYRLPCKVSRLRASDPAYQATLWHNRLFNPSLGDDVQVLSFKPEWGRGQATPKP